MSAITRFKNPNLVLDALTLAKSKVSLANISDPIDFMRFSHLERGDFATIVASRLSKSNEKNPRVIGQRLAPSYGRIGDEEMSEVFIPGPVFESIRFSKTFSRRRLPCFLPDIESCGRGAPRLDSKLCVDYLSTNPTDLLHFDHGQNAAVGKSLTHHLHIAGQQAARKFYVSDSGIRVAMLTMITIQRLILLRDGKPAAIGKRKQEPASLDAVIDKAGLDANRFIFLIRRKDTSFVLDPCAARRQVRPEQHVFIRPN